MEKKKIPTGALMRSFDQYAQAIRNERPIFVRLKDGKLIKHALTCLTEFQIEMLFVWFLKSKKDMRPTMGAALCKEVVSDFIRASRQEYGFYHQIENEIRRLDGGSTTHIQTDSQNITNAFEKLKQSFSEKFRA